MLGAKSAVVVPQRFSFHSGMLSSDAISLICGKAVGEQIAYTILFNLHKKEVCLEL
jgi:hypothetical protein